MTVGSCSELRTPIRPIWLCRKDAQPWPCGEAKLALLGGYHDMRVSLYLYLAAQFGDAMADLYQLNPD
jgi:hypothetical protein